MVTIITHQQIAFPRPSAASNLRGNNDTRTCEHEYRLINIDSMLMTCRFCGKEIHAVSKMGCGMMADETVKSTQLSLFPHHGTPVMMMIGNYSRTQIRQKFKPIFIKQTSYDEGEGYADVSSYEIDFLNICEWDIFDDWTNERGYYGLRDFADMVLEKFYGLVEKDDPRIRDYVME